MDEKILATLSTTEKDFNSIYPELLDTAKKLTDRWDPTQSNESDPMVVLLKELAIVGDKLNYNIDKNILENFPLSVTQLGNARKLYDMLGYKMQWYTSAQGDVAFKLRKTLSSLGLSDSYTINALTELTDSATSSTLYTTLQDAVLVDTSSPVKVPVIQGKVHTLTINGNDLITLGDLDEDLRIYLPETMIANNGIFVYKYGDNFILKSCWQVVDNILTYSGGQTVVEFGVTTDGTRSYIQFPQDIASVLRANNIPALSIKYVTTSGNSGNVKALTLDTFVNELTATSSDGTISMAENIKVTQAEPIINGSDPETLDQAYKNYKKSAGRFNTLVTKKDYESYVYYDAKDSLGNNIASNVIAADKTNDINTTNYIQTWNISGNTKKLVNNELNAYDVIFYMTQPSQSIFSLSTYDTTFTPIQNNQDGKTVMTVINNDLDNIKSIQHDLNLPPLTTNTEKYKFNINNSIAIRGVVYTYNKITKDEAKNIESNIINALYQNCNARELNYGEELAYDKLIDIISNADSNIRTFALTNLNNSLKVINTDGSVLSDKDKNDYNNELIARMVLAGNVQLIKFDDEFTYDFGQVEGQTFKGITKIDTSAAITIGAEYPKSTTPQIAENSIIQLYAPALITTQQYSGYGLKVNFDSNVTVNADEPTRLNVTVKFSNINGYGEQTLVNPVVQTNFDIKDKNELTLTSSQTISILDTNATTISKGMCYYFILNTGDKEVSELNLKKGEPYILKDNEYFWYASPEDLTDIVYLGAGTQLSLNSTSTEKSISVTCKRVTQDTLGTALDWQVVGPDYSITLTEMQIENIGQGYECRLIGDEKTPSPSLELGNSPKLLNYQLYTRKVGTEGQGELVNVMIKNDNTFKWDIQSRLQLNAGPDKPQTLTTGQNITLYNESGKLEIKPDDDSPTSLLLNYSIILGGGNNLDASLLGEDGDVEYGLNAYVYKKDDTYNLTREKNGYIQVKAKSITEDTPLKLPFTFKGVNDKYSNYILPICSSLLGSTDFSVYLYNGTTQVKKLSVFHYGDSASDVDITSSNNSYLYLVDGSGDSIYIKRKSTNEIKDTETLFIGTIKKLDGLNSDEIDSSDYQINANIANVESKMKEIDSNDLFDWTYTVADNKKVTYPTEPSSYWNKNHIYNPYTISRIDFKNSSIAVSPTNIE